MSKPTKVWALSSGSYSDYEVSVLFTTEEAAEEAAKEASASHYDRYNVEEFILYDGVPEMVTMHTMEFDVLDTNPSSVTSSEAKSVTRYPWQFARNGVPSRRVHVRVRRYPYPQPRTAGRVSGLDLQAVQQAFSDHRARVLDALKDGETPKPVGP